MKRIFDQWVSELSESDPNQKATLSDLGAIIKTELPYALNKGLSYDSPQLNELVEEKNQKTLLRELGKLDPFERRSRFTTWAIKIAVRIALTELKRRK
jgi:RNA polymerase sigma-70 factor (ECF subfamily)